MLRRGRKMMRLLSPTAGDRCRLCYVGFDGFTAPAFRLLGFGPWRRNPHFCEQCEAVLAKERGGAEIEIAMLYADVRGSTELAAGMRPAEFAALMQRFFRIATMVFTKTDAVVDKMVGDEVIGIYLRASPAPSIAGGWSPPGLSFCVRPDTTIPQVPGFRSVSGCMRARPSSARSASKAATISFSPRRPHELLCAARRRRQGRRDDR